MNVTPMNLDPTVLRALLAAQPALEFHLGQLTHAEISPEPGTNAEGVIIGALLALAIQSGEVPSEELSAVLKETMDALRNEPPRDLFAAPWKSLDRWTLTLRDNAPCLTGRDEYGERVVTSPLLRFQSANLAVTLRSVYRLGTPA